MKRLKKHMYLIVAVFLAVMAICSIPAQASSGTSIDLPMIAPTDNGFDGDVEMAFCEAIPPESWPTLCDYIWGGGETGDVADMILNAFEDDLEDAAKKLEDYLGKTLIDGMMEAFLTKLNVNENNLIDWWDTFWFYNFRPALQDLAETINVAQQDQLRSQGASTDSEQRDEVSRRKQKDELSDARTLRGAENVCVMATTAGGMGAATTFGKALTTALEKESQVPGLNKSGTPAASGSVYVEKGRHDVYESTFCDPNDNGGANVCGSTASNPAFYNADVQPTRTIYNRQTIPLDSADPYDEAVKAVLDNMMGTTSDDNIHPEVILTGPGHEKWLQRRAYLAKYAAVRSVLSYAVSRRTPGSGLGAWVGPLRQASGINNGQISGNPSYREVINATALDRFFNGKYALGQVTDATVAEREKLALSAMQLMMLRDYYELLERQALMLSIQVSVMAESIKIPSPTKLKKLN